MISNENQKLNWAISSRFFRYTKRHPSDITLSCASLVENPEQSVCENETNDASFNDNNGKYDYEKHGPVIHHLDEIQKQKNDERHFAAVIQSWLRPLLFGDQKEQVEKDYLDLTMIHYPHHKKYLDFMALQEGSVDRQLSLAYNEVLILITMVMEYFRTGIHKKDF